MGVNFCEVSQPSSPRRVAAPRGLIDKTNLLNLFLPKIQQEASAYCVSKKSIKRGLKIVLKEMQHSYNCSFGGLAMGDTCQQQSNLPGHLPLHPSPSSLFSLPL